ncbi:wall-associated receptor kinase-like 8 isoform X2 [Triticum dicoccoides]|uniref:wall-associated receptor kinase-like 8 isoform X2 n=1 Tax=Triticum dicoccoides TaxID=85692 RepID=UPI00188FB60D|nr:wall-associated receptor kinase-like 8 isoform X2 [Triticum dicoccoides]
MSTAMASLVLAVLVLPSATTAAVATARRNCSDTCGMVGEIPYPFGLGPSCSLPGFSLTCADNTSYPMLGNLPIESFDIFGSNNLYANILYSYNYLYARISYTVKMIPGVRNYSVHWEAPARHFAMSGSSNMLFVVGCGVKASLFIGNSTFEVGNCYVLCAEARIMEKLPKGVCDGIGCCFIDIQVNLRAFTLNISRTSGSARSKEVYAFISGGGPAMHALLITASVRTRQSVDTFALASGVTTAIPTSMAGARNTNHLHRLPLLRQPKNDCDMSCGNMSIPFPFGIKLGCFATEQFYLKCLRTLSGTGLPVLELNGSLVVTEISIDEGILLVDEKSEPSDLFSNPDTLYALSGKRGMVKWAIVKMPCEHGKLNETTYRCFSSHSDCVDVTNDGTLQLLGYRCKCSSGFEGNPYIKDGCADINECLQPDKYTCNGICHNKFGSYTCTSTSTDSHSNTAGHHLVLGITIGLSSGGGILFLAVFVAILIRRWNRAIQKRLRKMYFRKNKGILLEQLISSDKSANDGTKIFSLEDLEKATNNFDQARVVGRGGHGTVYKGILIDQRVVAIKKSTLSVISEIEEFINEVSILSQINHRNVVKLHGCCLESEVPLLVYEFISNGTLYDLLHRPSEQNNSNLLMPLSWEERLRIATEIAGALMYLHSSASVSVLHRDVKSMNVLLNDSYTAKVSDFGASRLIPIDQTHLVTAVQGTFGYLDPEYYYTGQLNDKSDVYSFGVILVELLTRRKPIIQNEHGEKQNLSNYFLCAMRERLLEETVDAQILGGGRDEGVLCMARLAEECLRLTREERPTMKDVEMRLQLLTGCRVAPRVRQEEEVGPVGDDGHGGVDLVVGQHGSRQFSQEHEFVSSLRVPR